MHKRVLWVVPLLVLVTTNSALAYFDIVGLYHKKVKSFEEVYFLKEDKTWHRDRRIFEIFGSYDIIGDDGTQIVPWEAQPGDFVNTQTGLLFNVRPNKGPIQMSFFNIVSNSSMDMDSTLGQKFSTFEALHGGRLTMGEVLEVSLGGYWRADETTDKEKEASGFLELNLPFIWFKSSYLVGMDFSSSGGRQDWRWEPDEFSFVDYFTVGLVRYDFDLTKSMLMADVIRLGFPKFRFVTFQSRFNLSDMELAWARVGLDMLFQFEEDFNLTRKGHFGTSIGLQAFYSVTNPTSTSLFKEERYSSFMTPNTPLANEMLKGYQLKFIVQAPAKWIITFLMGVAAIMSGDRRMIDNFSKQLQRTLENPKDVFFGRMEIEYTYNDPETFLYPLNTQDKHRIFFNLGFIY